VASNTLYILSGLPGVGKTTLSNRFAAATGAAYIRIDTVEQALIHLCNMKVVEEGYLLSYRLAVDNLKLGLSVVADSCNPIEATRKAWKNVALECNVDYQNIEIICSSLDQHRSRIEHRKPTIEKHCLPSWEDVIGLEYHPWKCPRIVIDTANQTPDQSAGVLMNAIAELEK